MKKLLVFFLLSFLVACKGGETETKVSNPPTQGHGNQLPPAPQPLPDPQPGPQVVDEGTVYPDLTDSEMDRMRTELENVLGGHKFEARPLDEKKILVGAGLEQASRNLRLEIEWQKMTEKDLKHLLNFFLTDDLKLKKEIR